MLHTNRHTVPSVNVFHFSRGELLMRDTGSWWVLSVGYSSCQRVVPRVTTGFEEHLMSFPISDTRHLYFCTRFPAVSIDFRDLLFALSVFEKYTFNSHFVIFTKELNIFGIFKLPSNTASRLTSNFRNPLEIWNRRYLANTFAWRN